MPSHMKNPLDQCGLGTLGGKSIRSTENTKSLLLWSVRTLLTFCFLAHLDLKNSLSAAGIRVFKVFACFVV